MKDDRAIPNRILWADAYTIGSHDLVPPEMRARAAYHIVFRRFAAPKGLEGFGEGKIIFHGLTGILKKTLGRPLEMREVEEAERLLATFHFGRRSFPIDSAMWRDVVARGCFPVRIFARPDGATVNVGEPVVLVVSEPGFGELAAHLEARLVQCWAPSARATLVRRWLDYNEDLVRRTTDVVDPAIVRAIAQMQTSDFGDRGGSCAEESEVLGLAHLTSHESTDTVAAAFRAWQATRGEPVGGSIRALAHRVVLGWGDEERAFRTIFDAARDDGISSHVIDCWDADRAVRERLVPLAREAARRGGLVVARPDSGDGLASILAILRSAVEAGLSKENGKNLIEMTSLRVIYADSLDFAKIRYELNEPLEREGFAPPACVVYGIGGFLRDCLSREMLGATLKLCAVGPELRPVAKTTGHGKDSVPGIVRVVRARDGGPTVFPAALPSDGDIAKADLGELRLVYDRGRFTEAFEDDDDFRNVRRRVLEGWDRFTPSAEPLSEEIVALRERLAKERAR